ncbi:zinc finger transcription factor ace1, partial [Trichoderma arundinaceum]
MASSESIITKAATTDTTSISDQVRAAGEIASHGLARSLGALRGLAFGGSAGVSVHVARAEPRGIHGKLHVQKRHLSGGAIAGVTVGVVFAVALLAICLYPCLLYIKRRRSGQPPSSFDAEAAIAAAAAAGHGSSTSAGASSPPKRLSSSDSYKPKGELTRGGDFGDRGSNDYGDWGAPVDNGGNNTSNGYSIPFNAAYLRPG